MREKRDGGLGRNMRIKMDGSPDDLIKRCDNCDHCIFEDVLTPEQRKIKVLKKRIPQSHVHRSIIEQICGHQYDEVCPMKYAAMRAFHDDRTAMQLGVVKNYIWDLGKKYKKKIEYQQAIKKWTTSQDLGKGIKESYAGRFNKIWDRGIRKITVDGRTIENQILSADFIYEVIMMKLELYDKMLKLFDIMIEAHKERDSI